jgi:hypothetical protein
MGSQVGDRRYSLVVSALAQHVDEFSEERYVVLMIVVVKYLTTNLSKEGELLW